MEMKYAALHRTSASPAQRIFWNGIPSEVQDLYMISVSGQYVRVVIELPDSDEMFFSLVLTLGRTLMTFFHKTLREEVEVAIDGRSLEDAALDAVASSFRALNPLDTISLRGDGAFLMFIRQQKGAPADTCFTDLL